MASEKSDDRDLPTDLDQSRVDLSHPHVLVMWEGGSLSRPVRVGESLTIGRAADCDLVVDHPSVSRRHALLSVGCPSRIEDLGSANGIRIGEVVLRAEHAILEQGRAAAIGGALLVVHGALGGPPRKRLDRGSASTEAGRSDSVTVVRDDETRRIHATVDLVAKSSIPVLLLGETGVGKDVLAEAIHRRSPRASRPFVRVNCAALPTALLESELFGFERGAFTGAGQAKAGLVESADGGTMFLDEIAEMDPSMQSKLLHVLERGEVTRLGSLRPRPVDVRFVAATNRHIDALVASGAFRKDLYFRLKGLSIVVPPLASRRVEIAPLAEHFLERACTKLNRPTLQISPAALECLQRYEWPGNIRELRNVVDRAAALCTGSVIEIAHLPVECTALPSGNKTDREEPPPRIAEAPEPMLDEARRAARSVERQHIVDALERCAGNQSAAARMLGISRRTLVARLAEYKIPRPIKDNQF